MSKLNEIIATNMTEEGVQNLVAGNVFARIMARQAVDLLKMEGGEAYAEYKAIKFSCDKGEKGLATDKSKQEAYRFALKSAAEIAASFYDPSLFNNDKPEEFEN